ncbi:MAG: signal peptidase I, partial [Clostridia bacterium]|nr:signal peptidase I [Clostridia bacterium]
MRADSPVIRVVDLKKHYNDGTVHALDGVSASIYPGEVVVVNVKRVIAGSGQWVNIDDKGDVYINDAYLNEPYIQKKAKGQTDIEYPYQVPEGKIFVMGDERETSVDSRTSVVGCIDRDQIIGKIVFSVWP